MIWFCIAMVFLIWLYCNVTAGEIWEFVLWLVKPALFFATAFVLYCWLV